LLVLDNMEGLRAAGRMLAELLQYTPHIKLLITSRERLGVAGEWLYEVQGLPYPVADADQVRVEYPACELFIRVARRIRPDFDPSAEVVAVNRICRLVDGSPLGIELAAQWVQVLRCAEIAVRLERSLDVLNTTATPVDERHRSMRVVLDASWNMLTNDEQRVFRRLSVFRGGCDLTAAEQVATATPLILAGLADKSWLRRDGQGRYQASARAVAPVRHRAAGCPGSGSGNHSAAALPSLRRIGGGETACA
jgi:predicted ATPase